MNSVKLIADVEIEASMSEGNAAPRFTVLAYTGGRLPGALKTTNGRADVDVVADLSGMSPSKSVVANLRHNKEQLVGHVDAVDNDGRRLILSGVASAATAYQEEVVGSARNGFRWQASIEAPIEKLEFVSAGKTAVVNGQTFTGPIYVARKSTLMGFAFVTHGADGDTSVSIAAQAATSFSGGTSMKAEVKAWAESMGINVEAASPELIAVIEANYEGVNKKPEINAGGKSSSFDEIRAENKRREDIRGYALEACSRNPHHIDAIERMADNAIEAKKSFTEFKLDLLDSLMPQSVTISSPRVDKRLNQSVLEAAVCQSAGLKTIEASFDDRTMQVAHDLFKGRLGLNRLFIEAARANGYRGNDVEVTPEIHNYAFRLFGGQATIEASGMSTLNVAGILSNTANKFLLEGWLGQDMEWKKISAIRPVRDFKTVTSYKLSGSMKYKKVGATGELKHGTVSEDTYTNKADTYGIMFAISRTDYINDDLAAFTQLPREAGYGANDAFNEVFWTEFLDNSAFFVAGNNNVSTGALSITNLQAAETVFLNQTKPNGTPLGLMPRILLVPTALKRTAMNIMNSPNVIDGTATGLQGATNTFANNFEVVSSPYMSNSLFTGNSALAYYLLADPNRLACIETALLNGREAPVVETADAAFNVLGTQLRAYHDFGVNLQEYRAGVRSTGA